MKNKLNLRKTFNDITADATSAQKKEYNNQTEEGKSFFNGVGGGPNLDPDPDLYVPKGTITVGKYKSSYITMGQQRNGPSPTDEFGGPNAHEIRLVSGGGGYDVKGQDSKTKEKIMLGPNPSVDGSMLVLMSKTDHRFLEYGVKTFKEQRLPEAAAILKSNSVAIVASSGDMYFTTGTEPVDYYKRRNISKGRIIFNPGNLDKKEGEPLNSLVLGNRVVEEFQQCYEIINLTLAQISALTMKIAKMNKAMSSHVHYGFSGKPTIPSIEVMTESVNQAIEDIKLDNSVNTIRKKVNKRIAAVDRGGENDLQSKYLKIVES